MKTVNYIFTFLTSGLLRQRVYVSIYMCVCVYMYIHECEYNNFCAFFNVQTERI